MGGSDICMDQLGGRVGVDRWPSGLSVLTRARICRSKRRKKRGAPVRLGFLRGGARVVETYQELRVLERLRDDLRRGACSGCRELLERDSSASEAFLGESG